MDHSIQTTALVTGAARGIGLAIAERLSQSGMRVLASDIDAEAVAELARTHPDRNIEGVVLDCSDRPAVAALFDAKGPVQVVVNNAGIASEMIPVTDLKRGEVERMLRVNVRGTFIVSQEAARRMTPGGRIINIASRGYLGGAGAGHYVASKAAVVGLTRAMAVELRWRGVNANVVAPGMIDTRMLSGFSDTARAALERREPSGRAASPTAIADIVAFLASEASGLINGQVLLADGGKALGVPPL